MQQSADQRLPIAIAIPVPVLFQNGNGPGWWQGGLGTGYWNQVKCTSRQYRARLASLKRFAMLPTRSKVEEGCKKGPTSCPTNYRFKTSEIKPPEWVSSVSRSPLSPRS